MDAQIRQIKLEDTEGIVAVLAELAREEDHASFDADKVAGLVQEYVNAAGRMIYVADRGGIIGYAAVHWIPFPMLGGREGYISDLVVGGTERGTGVGSRLLAAVEDRARELRCKRLMLNNRISSEAYQRGLYSKHGFQHRSHFANFVKILDQK